MEYTLSNVRAMLMSGKRITDIPLRVTFYARVSTENDDQLESLAKQIAYFKDKITNNPAWTLVDENGYIDEGISGTRIDKRKAFMDMLADAKSGKFDLILTKEVSRFARDIIDTVQTTRDLLNIGVGVVFEDLQLNTFEPDAEFRLSIMAIVAQEESRKTSERVKFGYRQSFKEGKRHGASAPIGYVFNNENDGYSIDPEKRPIVEFAFRTYAEGKTGLRKIGLLLAEKGYLSNSGKPYSANTIQRMLQNPTYAGYIAGNRSSKESYRSDKIIYHPKEKWVMHYVPDRVPPIVSRELWQKVNDIIEARSEEYTFKDSRSTNTLGYCKFAYSEKIFCGEHNVRYVHAIGRWKTKSGEPRTADYWRCGMYSKYGRKYCDMPLIYTDDLNTLFREFFKNTIAGAFKSESDSILKIVKLGLQAAKEPQTDIQSLNMTKDALIKKRSKILDGWVNGIISSEDYKEASTKIEGQIRQIENELVLAQSAEQKIAEVTDTIKYAQRIAEHSNFDTDASVEAAVRVLVDKIVVLKSAEENCDYELHIYIRGSDTPIKKQIGNDFHFSHTNRRLCCKRREKRASDYRGAAYQARRFVPCWQAGGSEFRL